MTYSEVVTKRIIDLCSEKNITINKLALLSGLRQSTLDNIIKGHTKSPGLRTLHRIAQGLNMTTSEFLNIPDLNNQQIDDE